MKQWMAVLLVCFCLGQVEEKKSRFAYVTVHYEGTKRDAEYVLGIQVLMQSIKLTKSPYDLVVLASNTVTAKSKSLFKQIGCRVIDVENIDNPFESSTLKNKGFIFTFNKLHVWNLLEYERVVYLDADNILLRNSDELFNCGQFCGVFMNPCHFHTGLMVITPNATEYARLLRELKRLKSFDGADQGFLSAVYSSSLRRAMLYRKDDVPQPLPPTMRLSAGYNLNHKYFYEQYHWKLYLLRHFGPMTHPDSQLPVVVHSAREIPAVTLAFPMAPILKPWYWWASIALDLHWVWQDVRSTIPADEEMFGMDTVALSVSAVTVLWAFVYVLGMAMIRFIPKPYMIVYVGQILRLDVTGRVVRAVFVLLSFWISGKCIHPLLRASHGFTIYAYSIHLALVAVTGVFSLAVQRGPSTLIPPVYSKQAFWFALIQAVVLYQLILVVSTHGNWFSNIIWKLIVIAVLGVLLMMYHVFILQLASTDELVTEKKHRADSHQA